MKTGLISLGAFSVIGKEGICTAEHNVVSELWADANAHFAEIAALARKEQDGSYAGFWGLMSDLGRHFLPWEQDYSTGLYLAGAEAEMNCPVPEGWVRWSVPEREYYVLEIKNGQYTETFRRGLAELPQQSLRLRGAVCDYSEPGTGKNFLFYPVEHV